MGNFEKLGILVIIVLVVVIIVVATVGTHDPVRTDVQLSSTQDVEEPQVRDRPVDPPVPHPAPRPGQNPEPGNDVRPPSPPAPPTPDPVPTTREYEVKEGDALWKIAARELGSGPRWTEIVALNPSLDPDRLKAGMVIKLPPTARARRTPARRDDARRGAPAGGRTYRIKDGDRLWNIARSHLGSGARWPEIVAANPSLNPDRLPVGESIVLPAR